jgi:hypothetical protein
MIGVLVHGHIMHLPISLLQIQSTVQASLCKEVTKTHFLHPPTVKLIAPRADCGETKVNIPNYNQQKVRSDYEKGIDI